MENINKLNDTELEQVAGGTLTEEEALEKALAHANLKRDQIDFVKRAEMDYEHGRKVWEIKFYQGRMEFEYNIDAENGSVLKFEQDYD